MTSGRASSYCHSNIKSPDSIWLFIPFRIEISLFGSEIISIEANVLGTRVRTFTLYVVFEPTILEIIQLVVEIKLFSNPKTLSENSTFTHSSDIFVFLLFPLFTSYLSTVIPVSC